VFTDFTGKVSTDISGLGVDTATDTTEEGDSGTTETISGDELEKNLNLVLNLLLGSSCAKTTKNCVLEDEDEDF